MSIIRDRSVGNGELGAFGTNERPERFGWRAAAAKRTQWVAEGPAQPVRDHGEKKKAFGSGNHREAPTIR